MAKFKSSGWRNGTSYGDCSSGTTYQYKEVLGRKALFKFHHGIRMHKIRSLCREIIPDEHGGGYTTPNRGVHLGWFCSVCGKRENVDFY